MTPIIIPQCDQKDFFSDLLSELEIVFSRQRLVIRKINYRSQFRMVDGPLQYLIAVDPANPIVSAAKPSLYLFYVQVKIFHPESAQPPVISANGWKTSVEVSYQQHAWFPPAADFDTTIYDGFEQFNGYDGIEVPVILFEQMEVRKVGVPTTNLSTFIDGYILYLSGGY